MTFFVTSWNIPTHTTKPFQGRCEISKELFTVTIKLTNYIISQQQMHLTSTVDLAGALKHSPIYLYFNVHLFVLLERERN